MRIRFVSFSMAVFLLTGIAGYAQKTASLADVAFMKGHWLGTFNGGPIEAFWAAPAGDNLTGFMRMMRDNKVTMYEMLVFEQTEQGPIVLVKHFKPGLIAVEEKEISDRYRFIESKKTKLFLRNKTAQFGLSMKNALKINWLFSVEVKKKENGYLQICLCLIECLEHLFL